MKGNDLKIVLRHVNMKLEKIFRLKCAYHQVVFVTLLGSRNAGSPSVRLFIQLRTKDHEYRTIYKTRHECNAFYAVLGTGCITIPWGGSCIAASFFISIVINYEIHI